jgi:enoyl-CoA hydratase
MSVTVEKQGPVWTVIMHRPEARNAVDGPQAQALLETFTEFDNDPEARVAVLWGRGGTFCAGADLKKLAGSDDAVQIHPPGEPAPLGISRLLLSKPVIAAVAGHAVAGGLELALWCDLRVAEKSAIFGVYCRRFGVPLVDGGTIRLPRLIGHSRALDMILTGRGVDAAEALSFGLANRVVPDGQSRPAAEALAQQLAAFPQLCMRADRQSSYEQWGMELPQALANEYERGMVPIRAQEHTQGAARFAGGQGRHGKFDE